MPEEEKLQRKTYYSNDETESRLETIRHYYHLTTTSEVIRLLATVASDSILVLQAKPELHQRKRKQP